MNLDERPYYVPVFKFFGRSLYTAQYCPFSSGLIGPSTPPVFSATRLLAMLFAFV